jgi:hypothetical protein
MDIHPSFGTKLLYDNFIFTFKIYPALSRLLSWPNLTQHLMRCTKWKQTAFNSINSDCHEHAFNHLTWQHHISTVKLIHDLTNTNMQSHLFYRSCPISALVAERQKKPSNTCYHANLQHPQHIKKNLRMNYLQG